MICDTCMLLAVFDDRLAWHGMAPFMWLVHLWAHLVETMRPINSICILLLMFYACLFVCSSSNTSTILFKLIYKDVTIFYLSFVINMCSYSLFFRLLRSYTSAIYSFKKIYQCYSKYMFIGLWTRGSYTLYFKTAGVYSCYKSHQRHMSFKKRKM